MKLSDEEIKLLIETIEDSLFECGYCADEYKRIADLKLKLYLELKKRKK